MRNKLFIVLSLIMVASMILAACATPTAEVVETVKTVVVEKVVEKEGEKVIEQVIVTATPSAEEAEEEVMVEEGRPVLRINLGTYPDIIDPQKSSFVNEIAHLKMMYEGLTTFDETLATVPGAAESWEYNDDATVLTFTMREGLTYSDGTPLNAARFEYSLRRNVNPETAGEYAAITDEILGAPEWRGCEGEEACAAAAETVAQSIVASHADGAACEGYEDAACNTLTITLSRPAPYFHTVMGLWVVYPAKEENIAEGGEIWYTSSKYQVGNGPLALQSLEPFVRAYFAPNENYWRGVGQVDIEYSYIVDSAVYFEAYKNDEFDIIALPAEDLPSIQADPELSEEATIYPGSCTFAVMFHQLKEPFTDQKVREAFAHALDRDGWVTDVLNELGSPTLTWIPPGFPGYDEGETRWGYDPEAALQAIADSSYGSVANLPALEYTISDTPRNRTRAEWLVAKWQEVFGEDLEITINPVESTTYTALTKDIATTPQFYILGWCADYPDPQNWLSVYWKTGAFGERIGYSNTDFDALTEQADTELDPATRADLYAQAQNLLIEGAPVAFMWNNVNAYLVKPWVQGLKLTPQDAGWPGDVDPISVTIDSSMQP